MDDKVKCPSCGRLVDRVELENGLERICRECVQERQDHDDFIDHLGDDLGGGNDEPIS